MGNRYNSQSISGYNASPPPDDASQTAANQVSWAKHKTKLGDPLKTLAEGVNSAADTAFGELPYYTTRSVSSTDSLVAADDHKIISCTNTFTFTLLPAATAGTAFRVVIFNAGTGTITVDGDSTETISGSETVDLSSQYDSIELWCDGTNWLIITDARVQIFTQTLPRSYLAGLQTTNNSTDSDHDIDVAVGECRGSDDDEDIVLSSALTKQIDASWAAGTNAGGLSSSLTLSADTWYHVHAINVGGSADIGFDTSITAANLVTDHSATAYRRICSVLTDGSSNIIGYTQEGNYFWWDDPQNDYTTTISTTPANATLSTPLGVRCQAIGDVNWVETSTTEVFVLVSSPDSNATVPGTSALTLGIRHGGGVNNIGGMFMAMTNTSSQVRVEATITSGPIDSSDVNTHGWIDSRGRDD